MDVLMRRNELHVKSVLRTIKMPNDISTNKLTPPRHIHTTPYGFICPLESPEGSKVGITKNLVTGHRFTSKI